MSESNIPVGRGTSVKRYKAKFTRSGTNASGEPRYRITQTIKLEFEAAIHVSPQWNECYSMSLSRRGLLQLGAAAVSARELPAMVPPAAETVYTATMCIDWGYSRPGVVLGAALPTECQGGPDSQTAESVGWRVAATMQQTARSRYFRSAPSSVTSSTR
jgi:hypothetical protein